MCSLRVRLSASRRSRNRRPLRLLRRRWSRKHPGYLVAVVGGESATLARGSVVARPTFLVEWAAALPQIEWSFEIRPNADGCSVGRISRTWFALAVLAHRLECARGIVEIFTVLRLTVYCRYRHHREPALVGASARQLVSSGRCNFYVLRACGGRRRRHENGRRRTHEQSAVLR
jgi:hypothetical protein